MACQHGNSPKVCQECRPIRMRLRKGSAVYVTGWPKLRGTVTEVRKRAARILFPVRCFQWFPIDRIRVVGFDGDGSRVHWR